MSEDRIRLLMGDFTKNAGLVGLYYMLEVRKIQGNSVNKGAMTIEYTNSNHN